MLKTFTNHLQLSQQDVERLFSLNLQPFLDEPVIQQKLEGLNVPLLQQSLPTTGGILAEKLPPFYDWLKNELGVQRVPDSPDHTTRWVVQFLNNQESLTRLVALHRSVPRPALEASIPRLVGLFDSVANQEVRQEWQRTIALLCFVLAVAAREEA
jgi:hypothetical protein